MDGHPFDVLHQFFGILENIVIDSLQEIAMNDTIGSSEPGGVRIVDVSKAIGICFQEIALKLEVSDYFCEIKLHLTSSHRFSG